MFIPDYHSPYSGTQQYVNLILWGMCQRKGNADLGISTCYGVDKESEIFSSDAKSAATRTAGRLWKVTLS